MQKNQTNPFSFIKDKVSILDVVSSYTSLKRAGMYWKGSCPFHSEKTGSFTVSPHKGIFYCFGCHMGGDVVTFIAQAENITPFEAVQQLADRFGVELPQDIEIPQQSSQNVENKKRYFKTYDVVREWCHQQLLKSEDALAYLSERNISKEIISTYKIGYFTGGMKKVKELINAALKENILVQDLLDAQILSQGKSVVFSPFEERIIFPITDQQGRPCAFGGRIFKENDERPKYYNSKETDYFTKGSTLFGFEHAKKRLQEKSCALIVEGYTDCVAMVHHGFTNTVATLGTACTADHLKLLSRYVHTVYVVFDGDEAGKKAMLRLTSLGWQVNLDLKIVCLPDGKDPASFLEEGGDLSELIEKAEDIFMFFIRIVGAGFMKKPLALKLHLTRRILELLKNIDEPLKKDLLLHTAAKTFGVPFQILNDELLRLPLSSNPSDRPQAVAPKQAPSEELKEIQTLEKKLFSVIINNMKLAVREDVIHLTDYFSPVLKNLLKRVQELSTSSSSCTFNDLYTTLTENEQQLISYLLIEYQDENNTDFGQLIMQFQKQHWKSLVISFQHKIKRAQENNDEILIKQLISEFQSLKQRLVTRGL